MSLIPLPEFSELPLQDSHPPHSCWGLWSGNGFDDQLGSLNYLTDALVLKAMKEEIQSGERVGLKLNLLAHSPSISNSCTSLPLDFISPPFYKRAAFSKQLFERIPELSMTMWLVVLKSPHLPLLTLGLGYFQHPRKLTMYEAQACMKYLKTKEFHRGQFSALRIPEACQVLQRVNFPGT
jgi:hypothetical protein